MRREQKTSVQTKTPIKAARRLSEVCTSHSVIESVGESCSTLGASSFKNFSAVRGCHSFSETVFLFSLSLLGLVCSFHRSTSFKVIDVKRCHATASSAYSYESILYYSAKLAFCQEKKQIFCVRKIPACFAQIIYTPPSLRGHGAHQASRHKISVNLLLCIDFAGVFC